MLEWQVGTLAGPMGHVAARGVIRPAFVDVFRRPPTLAEEQGAQVTAWQESNYGAGWRNDPDRCPTGDCAGRHNWGAIVVRHCSELNVQQECPPGSFLYLDRLRGQDCWQCFRSYASDVEGARHLIEVLYKKRPTVLAAASRGDLVGMATAMRDTVYYVGKGETRQEQIDNRVAQTRAALELVASGTGEPKALDRGPISSIGGSRSALPVVIGIAAAAAAVLTYPTWSKALAS